MQKILNNKSFDELKTWKDLVDHQKKLRIKVFWIILKMNLKEWNTLGWNGKILLLIFQKRE